jgi:hypothetical protein
MKPEEAKWMQKTLQSNIVHNQYNEVYEFKNGSVATYRFRYNGKNAFKKNCKQ